MAAAKQPAKPQDLRPVLTDQDVLSHFVRAHTMFETVVKQDQLPLVWEAELGFARKIVANEPAQKLRLCVPETLQNALENIAAVGLTLNPIKQHITLIPRYNEKLSVWECHPMPMYRGLAYLGTQAGVTDMTTEVVYKADTFKVGRRSDGDYFDHEIAFATPRGGENQFQGAYNAAKMPGGTTTRKVEWVPAEDIYKMRESSDAYRDKDGNLSPWAPWVRWFDEQAKKSTMKRASKRWEESLFEETKWQRLQRAVTLDHYAETGGRTFDSQAEPIEVPKLSMEQVTEIEAKATELYPEVAGQKHFLTKICNAYGREALSELSAQHFQEVIERIEAAKQAILNKRAKAKTPNKPPAK